MSATIDLSAQAEALKTARVHRGWSQSRLAAALEQAAHTLSRIKDLPAGGRQTLIQYISYFENGKRAVPDRLKPIFREAFQATDEELRFTEPAKSSSIVTPPALSADHLRSSAPVIISSLQLTLSANVQADALIGPVYLLPAVEAQLPVIEQICRETRGADHEEALRFGSRFMQFCGWLYQDSGDYECAMYWTDRSLEYAAELDDRQVISYVLMRKSNIATDSGNPGYGHGRANAALKRDYELTPRLRAVALRQRAIAYAMLNEPVNFAQDVENALIHATIGESQDEADLAPYCTPSYVQMEAGAAWLRLNAASSAIPVFEDSRTQWSAVEQTRDRALCLARLATAYAATGEPELACSAAEDLISVADGLGSARVTAQIAALRTSLSQWHKDQDVADLLHRLQTFKVPLSKIERKAGL